MSNDSEIRNGDILLYKSKNRFIKRALKIYSGYSYSHASIIMNNKVYEFVREGNINGITIRPLRRKDKFCDSLRVTGGFPPEELKSMQTWLDERVLPETQNLLLLIYIIALFPIKWIGILFYSLFGMNLEPVPYLLSKYDLFCSNTINDGFKDVLGIDLLKSNEKWTAPGDLIRSNYLDYYKMVT